MEKYASREKSRVEDASHKMARKLSSRINVFKDLKISRIGWLGQNVGV